MSKPRGARATAKRPRARGKTPAKRRKARPKPSAKASAAQRRRRRAGAAAVVAVLAFLIAAAVFPVDWLGSRVAGLFPLGNPMGAVGERLDAVLTAAMGVGRFAVPALALASAASIGTWWSASNRKGVWIASLVLVALLPVSASLAGAGPGATGILGAALGGPLLDSVGWLGGWVAVFGVAVATSMWAFRFNPLAPPAAAALRLGRSVGAGLDRAKGYGSRLRRRRRERKAERVERDRARSAPAPAPKTSPPAAEAPVAEATRTRADTVSPADDLLEDPPVVPADYPLPPMDLFVAPSGSRRVGMERELDRLSGVLADTLQVFKIDCRIAGRTTGPAVTQYEVVPSAGVKVNRIANLDADLALAMKATSVRIVAPIPGKGAVGVEIPNPEPEIVRLREILEAPAFARSAGRLPLGLGKDLTGRPFVTDLAKMPHALIAGATGSGKSVCLNTIITSLACRHGPDRLRLLLIDPKMVELSSYADLPHLRHPVVTDPGDAAGVLKWAVLEMERRYALLSANGVRSLTEFNERLENGRTMKRVAADGSGAADAGEAYADGPLPWIVVVVDELADLMMTVQAEVERPLTQLAQKARAIGIHLLVATQRPSVNVVTGLIKANFPCRIAFRVASKTDSRTILDQNGADSLLGSGDMLFLPPGQGEPLRMQGAFVSTDETEALMDWFRAHRPAMEALKSRVRGEEADILDVVRDAAGADEDGSNGAFGGDWDSLFRQAAEACLQQGSGSTSLLQRRLRIGYGRAARIVDQLCDAGVLGPPDGSKPREVLVGDAGLDEICPS